MNSHWKFPLFFFILASCCLGFQSPPHQWSENRVHKQYSADFPKVIRPQDASFERDSLLAVSLGKLSLTYYHTSRWDSFLLNSRRLRQIGEKLLEQKIDSALIELWYYGYADEGQAKIYLGEVEDGYATMHEAFTIRQRLLPGNQTAVSYYTVLGHMALNLFNDPELAFDYYRMSESVARNISPAEGESRQINLILGYCRSGDFSTGVAYFNKVYYGKYADNYTKVWGCIFLAREYLQIRDFENARKALRLAEQIEPEAIDQQFVVHITRARAERELGNLRDGARQLQQAENLLKTHSNEFASGRRIEDLTWEKSLYALASRKTREGIALARMCIQLAETSGMGKFSPKILLRWQHLTETLLLADSLPAAQAALTELLTREARGFKTVDFAQNPPVAAFTRQPYHLRTLELKGRFFEKMFEKTGDPTQLKNALKTYALADSLIENIRDTYRGTGSKNQLSGAAKPIFQRMIDCAFQLWQHSGDDQYLHLAWQAAEKSKSVELLESLRETEAKQLGGFRPEDQQHEKLQKRNLDFYEKLVFDEQAKPHTDSSRISDWNRKIFDLKASQDSLLTVFQKRYPEYHRLKYDRRLATIADVQAKLPAGNALVEYFLGDSVLFTFLIDKGQARIFRQKTDSSLQQNFAALRTTVHNFDPATPRTEQQKRVDFQKFTRAAHALYQTLLAEPLAHTRARNLVVVPDDQIGYVPFAALLRRQADAPTATDYRRLPYLVHDVAVRLEYSGTLLARQPIPGIWTGSGGGYLGMAPVYQGGSGNSGLAARALPDNLRFARAFSLLRGGEVPALQFNGLEIDSTRGFLKGETAAGEGATEAFFKKNAPNAGVLHLAMHALTNDVDPLYSTLLFSNPNPTDSTGENDGFLHAYELYKLRLRADLAVLSACNTGAGKIVRGEGIMSLARAFRFAGCPNVMMSLWSVNDAAAKDLVVGFFQKLSGGVGKAAALQVAQQDFLKNTRSDALMHPYYWATFSMVGDDEPVRFGGDGLWIWGVVLVALGSLWAILRYFKRGVS